LLGIGGGIVIVPALFFLYHWQDFPSALIMHMAVGSSLATVVFTSLTSTYAHHHRGAVLWPCIVRLIPGIVAGAWLGAVLADHLPERALRSGFGLFELLVAAQLVFGFKPQAHQRLPGPLGMAVAGLIIGTVSTVLGIGGGTLTVPFLLWCNVNLRQAVATSAACGLPIALAGAIGFAATGWDNSALPPWSSGYIYWPAVVSVVAASTLSAPVGAWLAHTLPIATLRRLFAMIVALIGIRMLF
jgi:uncharacterized membrane protein YfcA